jgi:hypothetical protein
MRGKASLVEPGAVLYLVSFSIFILLTLIYASTST